MSARPVGVCPGTAPECPPPATAGGSPRSGTVVCSPNLKPMCSFSSWCSGDFKSLLFFSLLSRGLGHSVHGPPSSPSSVNSHRGLGTGTETPGSSSQGARVSRHRRLRVYAESKPRGRARASPSLRSFCPACREARGAQGRRGTWPSRWRCGSPAPSRRLGQRRRGRAVASTDPRGSSPSPAGLNV